MDIVGGMIVMNEEQNNFNSLGNNGVPNISQLHLFVNNIDDRYIYLFSYIKTC